MLRIICKECKGEVEVTKKFLKCTKCGEVKTFINQSTNKKVIEKSKLDKYDGVLFENN